MKLVALGTNLSQLALCKSTIHDVDFSFFFKFVTSYFTYYSKSSCIVLVPFMSLVVLTCILLFMHSVRVFMRTDINVNK